jgi:MFS family permease
MPFVASLSDIFGRAACLWTSILCFTVGTSLCCAARSIVVLLVGRAIQGIGGGGVIVMAQVIFTDFVPLRYRPRWFGIVYVLSCSEYLGHWEFLKLTGANYSQGGWALGTCVGPVVGGAIAQNTTWRWIFYMMFPFLLIGLLAVPLLLTLRPPTSTFHQKLARIDWIGAFLFVGGITAFLIAVSWGGSQYPWLSFGTLSPLLVGSVCIIVALAWMAYFAKEPFLRRTLFRDVGSVVTYFCGLNQGLMVSPTSKGTSVVSSS